MKKLEKKQLKEFLSILKIELEKPLVKEGITIDFETRIDVLKAALMFSDINNKQIEDFKFVCHLLCDEKCDNCRKRKMVNCLSRTFIDMKISIEDNEHKHVCDDCSNKLLKK